MLRYATRAMFILALLVGRAPALTVLVYNDNAVNDYAETAANNLGATVTVADSSTFNTQLGLGGWDVVAVDMPSNTPSGGFTDLTNYVLGGGRVAMSFWQWDGEAALTSAFGGTVVNTISLVGETIETVAGPESAAVFAGVTMPNSSWHDNWSDDGDTFTGGLGLAKLQSLSDPVMILANGGKTIAAPVIDEWQNLDGSPITLWENMISYVGDAQAPVVPEPGTCVMLLAGGMALARRRRAR